MKDRRAYWREYSRKHLKEKRQNMRLSSARPDVKKRRAIYNHQRNLKRKHVALKDSKFPEKIKARNKLRYAIFIGRVKRMPCIECGNQKSHGHHDDYTKPYNVTWLCSTHHGIRHRKVD